MDTLTRERITYEINEDGYVILLDGTPWITQDRTNLPYPDRTLEECCQQQIEDLLTAAAEAAQAQINAEEQLAKNGFRPTRIEGVRNSNWVLMDYNDVILHVFSTEDREFYNLDHIWKDAEVIERDTL